MASFFVREHDGTHTLQLVAGTTAVDHVIEHAGHEPNGYFWEGVAALLIASQAPALEGRFEYDSEGGTFVVRTADRTALDWLHAQLAAAADDTKALAGILKLAQARGFQFDD